MKYTETAAKNALVVAVFFTLTLASYQPKIAFLGLLCLCYLLTRIAGRGTERPCGLKDGINAVPYVAAVFLTACLLYFVSVKLSVSYDIGVRTHVNSAAEMLRQSLGSYAHFVHYYTREADYLPRPLMLLPALVVGLGCLALLARAYRRSVASLALAAVLLLLMPIPLRTPYIINQHTWANAGRITFAYGYALLFFLSCSLQVAQLRKLGLGVFGVFLYFFAVLGTQESNAAALKTIYDLHIINRIAARIETEVHDLYTKQHALMVVGRYPEFARQKYVRYTNAYHRSHAQTHAFEPYRQPEILNYFLGQDVLRRPTPLQREQVLASVSTRPPWPAHGSVYIMDDVIVVVLEPYSPNVAQTWTTAQ